MSRAYVVMATVYSPVRSYAHKPVAVFGTRSQAKTWADKKNAVAKIAHYYVVSAKQGEAE